ncbi:hypothetical protein PsorP6_011044 [Peronosclerospora sorghi]|uniref:Uncharacterized protein n=1 Tax=Peronosclerospora sorghi TaxID=230839 RepID=A0ACC0VVC7_9STRA|nr:hypothetical protein PsorP6_011044 [Peronosclerospora sorghi]
MTELAWQHHFVTNMFIRPEFSSEAEKFHLDFTVIYACTIVDEDWKAHGLHSEVFVLFNIERHMAIIDGKFYGGGGTQPFSLDTGKTTLSADSKRELIGDDEHGWDDEGIFTFEGGCYAKTIDLSKENEPDVFNAIRPNAMLENVRIDANNEPDYFNSSKTENERVSYTIYHLPHHEPNSRGNHPNAVIFLTCDAYGVMLTLPKLYTGQTQYHSIGYTAKLLGTERAITEPQATFSTCFGAALMTLHPTKYADLLKKKRQEHKMPVYLINTGWTRVVYGVGKRMEMPCTRKCVGAVLDGHMTEASFVKDPLFCLEIPTTGKGVPSESLNPRYAWSDKAAFDPTAHSSWRNC